jgi:FixJ family two-component response regulator
MKWEMNVSEQPLIVCVDDDQAICEAMSALLKALGFAAETFLSAEALLHSGALDDIACLITDVQLGGMSGLQLQTRLIELGYRIPIIMITAFPDERIRNRALSAGVVCFLSKPFLKADLLSCIHSALARG